MKSNVLLVALSAAVLASCGAANGASTEHGSRSHPDQLRHGDPDSYDVDRDNGCRAAPATRARCTPKRAPTSSPPATIPSTIAGQVQGQARRPDGHQRLDACEWSGAGVQQSGSRRDDQDPTGLDRARHRADTTGTGTTPSTETTTTIAGGQSACAPGEYTIVAGDYPAKVAKKLDTTVDALNAANVNTPGYASFYVGLKIKTPPKANC